MKCLKHKSFLWIKYTVIEHDMEMTSLGKFMDCSDSYHVNYTCKVCGLTRLDKFVEKDTLYAMGVAVEILEEVSARNWYYF